MNRFVISIGFALVLFFGCTAQKEKKVLIVGIDGCRSDVLKAANTPSADTLIKNGAYTYKAQTDPISSSGICWTSMLTGVWHEKHNVTTNSYKNPNVEEYPHLFRRIKEHNPDLITYSIVNWAPIHKILQDGDANKAETYSLDEKVAENAANILSGEDVDILFVQLDDVDHAGHAHDFSLNSPKYVEAVELADQQLGKIVQALKKRPDYANEDWLIIVTTDHGGSNFSHGKDIPEHTTIFYIASGESTLKEELTEVKVVDVATTAMHHLGLNLSDSWSLDGKVRGIKQK